MSEGYYEITLIPSGSRHILIEEMGPSKNFIGIGKADSSEFYLNGDRLISMSGEYQIAGATGLYERENEMEKLKIPGPIKEDIALFVSITLPFNSNFHKISMSFSQFLSSLSDRLQRKAQKSWHSFRVHAPS